MGGTFAFLALILVTTIVDPDLWGHVRFGLDIIEARGIVRTDPYSYLSEPGTWINHEWLAEVIMAAAWRALGARGLVLLKVVVSLAALAAVYRAARVTGAGVVGASVSTLVGGVLLRARGLVTVRPHMFTILGFALVLLVLVCYERRRRPRLLLSLPPLFAVWVNMHGGFLAGLACLLIWAAARALGSIPRRSPRDGAQPAVAIELGCCVLCILATLANPYGLQHWAFLLRTATVPRPEITEWRSIADHLSVMVFYLMAAASGAYLLYRASRPRSTGLTVLYAVLALAPLVAVRHIDLMALALAVVALPRARAWRRLEQAVGGTAPRPAVGYLPWLLPLGLVTIAVLRLSSVRLEPPAGRQLPAGAVAWLGEHVAEANLVTPFNWGEYVLWHLGPDIKVSMDGRRETVYAEEIYQQYLAFSHGRGRWDELIDAYPTDLVLTTVGSPGDNLMALKPGWVSVYEDELSAIYAPASSALSSGSAVQSPSLSAAQAHAAVFPDPPSPARER